MFDIIAAHIAVDAMKAQFSASDVRRPGEVRRRPPWWQGLVRAPWFLIARSKVGGRPTAGPACPALSAGQARRSMLR